VALSDELLGAVKQAEGLRTVAYKDTLGNWTVGHGHKLATGKDWAGYAISTDTASALLTLDLNEANMAAIRLPEWVYLDTPARQDSVIELCFNMGAGKWIGFKRARLAMRYKQWDQAAEELLDSEWARQVGQGRSGRISEQIRTGEYKA
jgi:lysozyme